MGVRPSVDSGPGASDPDMGDSEVADLGPEDGGYRGPPDPGPALPVVPAAFGFPQALENWRLASSSTDPWTFDWLNGTMPVPDLGVGPRNLTWVEAEVAEDGSVSVPSGVRVYLAGTVTVAETRRYVVSLDGYQLSVDGAVLPNDPYRTGRHLQPVVLEPGAHRFIARGDSVRGPPRLRIWRVDVPVVLNALDATVPDLVRGSVERQPLGIHVANATGEPLVGWKARVFNGPFTFASARTSPPIPAGATTQVAFDIFPREDLVGDTATITLSLEPPDGDTGYAVDINLSIVDGDAAHRRTFVSDMDQSVQYYGVVPPLDFDPSRDYALALSLHGAAVEAIGQARAYGAKDWAYIIAPTNRRPFGFDWQDWGRLDALEALEHAKSSFNIDPEQVHVTGHSMGGHGTWHLGVLHPDRFAVVAPSAGWPQYSLYGGQSDVPSSYERARFASDTMRYLNNFADRPVYIVHGEEDNNVPVSLARFMHTRLQSVTSDLYMHIEPGAGHWWDGYPEPGAQCVDWPGVFDLMQNRRLDRVPTRFDHRSPGPWVNDRFGFVRVLTEADPLRDVRVVVDDADGRLRVTTYNVAQLEIDGDALIAEGFSEVEVDGALYALEGGVLRIGEGLKQPGVHGPFKELFFRPHCYIYPDGSEVFRALAAYLVGEWSILGNGKACALPLSRVADAGDMNRVYLGVPSSELSLPEGLPFSWAESGVTITGQLAPRALLGMVFPENGRLAGVLYATPSEAFLGRLLSIFNGRSTFPDYFTYTFDGQQIFFGRDGFFDGNFAYDPDLERQ